MSQLSTAADWAPYLGISLPRRLFSFVRSTFVVCVVDTPVYWWLGFTGKNPNDDIEGPFYIKGSPRRDIEEGKGVLASPDMLRKNGPVLLLLDIKDAKGNPIPNATVDAWQADCNGSYYFRSWTLRGNVTTDARGRAEILTVRPADYGAFGGKRAGHVHLVVSGVKGKHVTMTTQAYVCPGNRAEHMDIDFAQYMRKTPHKNMATFWSISAANGGEKVHNFPELPSDDIEAIETIKQWNGRLKAHGIDREVLAIGRHELKLTLL